MSATRLWAVVPAAGAGVRMGADRPKQYLPLAGRPVLAHTLETLLDVPAIEAVVLVVAAGDGVWRDLVPPGAPVLDAPGGPERCHSVRAGLDRLAGEAGDEDWVMVHDAARPCVSREEMGRLLEALADEPVGALLALPVADTLKRASAEDRVEATVPRQGLWRALTPQVFRYGLLRDCLAASIAAGELVTDEAAAMERGGHRPRLVRGSAGNIKITGPEDLALAEAVLAARRRS